MTPFSRQLSCYSSHESWCSTAFTFQRSIRHYFSGSGSSSQNYIDDFLSSTLYSYVFLSPNNRCQRYNSVKNLLLI